MKLHWKLRWLALIALGGLLSCAPSEDYIDARIRLAMPEPSQVILGAGQDRHTFNQMDPGETQQTRVAPGRSSTLADERRLHVIWWGQGQRHEWAGPEVPPGVSYRIHLELHADGRVDSEHCVMPCSLPER